MTLKKRALRALIVYSLDMGIAIAGMLFGFGLHVVNWPALIGLMLFSRFAVHLVISAVQDDDAKAVKGATAKASKGTPS